MGFYNPFSKVIESINYPHSRTLRTSFRQKLSDTFHVFAGSFFTDRSNHLGLFDYATFLIPYSLTKSTIDIATNQASVFTLIPLIPMGAIAISTAAVRYSVAAVMTAIVSPVVAATHLVSTIKGDEFKNKINTLSIIKNPNDKKVEHKPTTLGNFLNNRKETLEDIDVDFVGTYKKFSLLFHDKGEDSIFCCCYGRCECCPDSENHVTASSNFNLDNKKDRNNFRTLLKLNVGGLTSKLEKIGANFSLFKKSVPCNEKTEIDTYLHRNRRFDF